MGQDAALSSLEAERFRGGCGDLAPRAAWLVDAALAASGSGRALSLSQLAVLAAPDDPRPRAALFREALRQGLPLGYLCSQAWGLVRAAVCDPWFLAVSGLKAAAVAALAALLTSLSLLACGFTRAGACLFHDFSDAFPQRLRRFTPSAFLVLMSVAFFGAGVGPLTMVTGLGLLSLPYLKNRLRWALGLSLTLMLALWGGLGGLARVGDQPGKGAWAYYRAFKGDAGTDLDAALAAGGGELRPSLLLARAAAARRLGRYEAAGGFLNAAIKAGADEGSARVELGNLLFLKGQWREAEAEYVRALAAKPRDAVPWLNLHVVYLKRIELGEADKALENARLLDPARVDRFQHGTRGGRGALLPVSVPLAARPVFEALWLPGAARASTWPEVVSESLFVGFGGVKPLYLAGFALVAVFFAGLGPAERHSRRCPGCGAVVCPRCSRRIRGERLCSACWSLAGRKGAGAVEKEHQRALAAAWQRRARTWGAVLHVAAPGWNAFSDTGSLSGLAVGMLWGLGAGILALGALYPVSALPWPEVWLGWFPWCLVLACHADGLRRALSMPRARAGR